MKQKEVKNFVMQLEEQGIIRPCVSPYNSNNVIVSYPDGSLRFTTNFRPLNQDVEPQFFPLPAIRDVQEMFRNKKYISELDLNKAFFQIPLAEEDQLKTAFTTCDGQYAYKVVPMGLKTSSSAFQRFITILMSGLAFNCVLSYIDNIYCFSDSFDDHVYHMALMLSRLRFANLTVSAAKCFFARKQLKCLGFIVSGVGVRPDPEKISAVKNMRQPKTVRELASFLNFCGFYRVFIKDMARIAKPLTDLLKENVPPNWTNEQNDAFENLKNAITSDMVLRHYDENLETEVRTDASGAGLGAILLQKHGKHFHPVAFASRVTTEREAKFSPYDLESLGLVYALKEFRQYLLAISFRVVTDCHALCFLLSQKQDLNGKLARWSAYISQYNFTLVHKSGAKHADCDALSRLPQNNLADALMDEQDSSVVMAVMDTEFDMATEQDFDPNLKSLKAMIQSPTPRTKRQLRRTAQLSLSDNLLLKQVDADGKTIVVPVIPSHLVRKVIGMFHDSLFGGHQGVTKTVALLKRKVSIKNLYKEVVAYVSRCRACARRNVDRTGPKGLL